MLSVKEYKDEKRQLEEIYGIGLELEIAVWTQVFQRMELDTGVNTCVWINKEHA